MVMKRVAHGEPNNNTRSVMAEALFYIKQLYLINDHLKKCQFIRLRTNFMDRG